MEARKINFRRLREVDLGLESGVEEYAVEVGMRSRDPIFISRPWLSTHWTGWKKQE